LEPARFRVGEQTVLVGDGHIHERRAMPTAGLVLQHLEPDGDQLTARQGSDPLVAAAELRVERRIEESCQVLRRDRPREESSRDGDHEGSLPDPVDPSGGILGPFPERLHEVRLDSTSLEAVPELLQRGDGSARLRHPRADRGVRRPR
jgi:hypothetical protein